MPRDWSGLSQYGKREYKFVQRDSYSLIIQDYPFLNNGVCMGVVMSWIQEKLTTSNGFLKPQGHLGPSSEPRQFANSLNPLTRLSQGVSVPGNALAVATLGKLSTFEKGKSGPRNEATMRRGADNQLLYEFRGVDAVAQNLGLIQNHDLSVKRMVQRGQGNSPVVQEGPTIANATLDLQNGSAMLIELEQDGVGAGHAIAWYRSRKGTLYFFDPNTGVYEVSGKKPEPADPMDIEERQVDPNIVNFVAAWLDVYAAADQIGWKTARTNWYRVYRH